MSIIGNIGGQSGGGSLTKSILIVAAPTGSTVTVTKGSTTKTAMAKNGEWWFKNLENGEWTIRATLDGQSATETYNITQFGVYRRSISYRMTPEFTYTGDYEIVQDDDTPIADFASWKGNWKIRFLTSGDFTITKMYGFTGVVDVFLVAGGGAGHSGGRVGEVNKGWPGGGGGSGETSTNNAKIKENTIYQIIIGGGGTANGGKGGNTSAFGQTANGGFGGYGILYGGGENSGRGGNGGSGGGQAEKHGGSSPGSDGNNAPGSRGGKGQGKTTREFSEPGAKLYATGGYGNGNKASGQDNTGNGGNSGPEGGGYGNGGSGIVVMRNARAA